MALDIAISISNNVGNSTFPKTNSNTGFLNQLIFVWTVRTLLILDPYLNRAKQLNKSGNAEWLLIILGEYNFIKLENENIQNIDKIKDDKKEVNVDNLDKKEKLEFGLEKIKQEWKKFVEIINDPNLKPPLRLAIPKKLEDNKGEKNDNC